MSKNRTCRFCYQAGHAMNNCKHESITELYKECVDVSTFSLLILGGQGLVYTWLSLLTLREKKVLLLRSKGKGLISDAENEKEYDKTLCCIHYWSRIKETKASLDEKFATISDERFRKFIDLLIEEMPQHQNAFIALSHRLRPPQIKFPIVPSLSPLKEEEHQKEDNEKQCPICYETTPSPTLIKTNCGHSFCSPCLKKYFKSFNKTGDPTCIPGCPMCRTKINTLAIAEPILFTEFETIYCL